MALVAGDKTRTPQRMDWRGRPLGEGVAGSIPPVERAEDALHATLRLPSFPAAYSAGPRSKEPLDPVEDVMRTAPEGQQASAIVLVQPQASRQPLAKLRPKYGIPEVEGDCRHVDQMTDDGMVFLRPGVDAELGPEQQ